MSGAAYQWQTAADGRGWVLRLSGPQAAAAARLRSAAMAGGNLPQWERSSRKAGRTWLGVESVEEADRVLAGTQAWTPGEDAFSRALAACEAVTATASVRSTRRRRRRGAEGDELCADTLYSGNLDRAWIRCEREAGSAPRAVRIVVDICGSSSTLAADLVWPGAAAVALGERLSAAGRSVEVESTFHTDGMFGERNVPGLVSCVLKGAGEAWNRRRALAWAAFPGAMRRAGFLAACSAPAKVYSSYGGIPLNAKQRFCEMTGESLDGVIFVPALRSEAAAVEFVQAALSEVK